MIDKDTTSKLKDIETRLNAAKTDDKKVSVNAKGAAASGVSFGFRLATELLGGVIVGGGIGCFLDKVFNTEPVLFVFFLLFGGAAGVLNVYRMVKKLEEEKESKLTDSYK